jgi:hypothetical protein
MQQLKSYADERLIAGCIHCARATETRDHVPSRILLDEPYPENLPVLPACAECNTGFSLDEEYFACLVECARVGSVEAVERPKIRRIFAHSHVLASRLNQARRVTLFGDVTFSVENQRAINVATKLARGHAAFELSQPLHHAPNSVRIAPLCTMQDDARGRFETPLDVNVWPEVGSRAMQRLVVSPPRGTVSPGWVVVQDDRYRYLAVAEHSILVRIVVSEYLACEVVWSDPYP